LKITSENSTLNDDMRTAQDNLRQSSAQLSKINAELNEYKNQINNNNKETELLKQKMQKLASENNVLDGDMRNAQENLRLSAGQINKLSNDLKGIFTENEELKKKVVEYESVIKRLRAESDNKVNILTQECERLNSIVEKKNIEIRSLGGEVQEAQENLRLSAAQASKMGAELNEYRNRLGATSQ
jgi:chromosome segregation ATPase